MHSKTKAKSQFEQRPQTAAVWWKFQTMVLECLGRSKTGFSNLFLQRKETQVPDSVFLSFTPLRKDMAAGWRLIPRLAAVRHLRCGFPPNERNALDGFVHGHRSSLWDEG